MLQQGDDDEAGSVKFRLRRTRTQQTIQENLKCMSYKKHRAQDRYYGPKGQSPLIRSIAKYQERGQSIHERLGQKRMPFRRMNIPPETSLLPKNRLPFRLRRTTDGGVPLQNRNRFKKRMSVQNRLQRIRMQQQGVAIQNALQEQQNQKHIRLRRGRPDGPPLQPINYTMHVNNMAAFGKKFVANNYKRHSVAESLTPALQSEIQIIQMQSQSAPEIILEEPIFVPGYGKTKIALNQRFSAL